MYLIVCQCCLDRHWHFIFYLYYFKKKLITDTLLYEQLSLVSASSYQSDIDLECLIQSMNLSFNNYWVVTDEMCASENNTSKQNMTPWFVELQKNLKQLTILEMSIWLQLAETHWNLKMSRSVFKTLFWQFVTSLFRFSAAVKLSELSSLLNALVYCAQWDSPAVLAKRDLLLKSDQKAAACYVCCWCAWAQKCMNECFQHL